jgi:hypothetical protein
MSQLTGQRVAVIGAGISGIAAANILQKNGFSVVVFEKSEQVGGVWAVAYPDIRLQNIGRQYHLSGFPWPFTPDFHPTGDQILRYLREAVKQLQIDVCLRHEVLALEEEANGWLVHYKSPQGSYTESFDYVMISVGQYTESKNRPHFPGEEHFNGTIVTERDIGSLELFTGRQVVVVGFGKSAVDMATFAAKQSQQVTHLFRTPRWLIPEWIGGMHMTYALFSRFGTVMMPGWAQPTLAERFLHNRLGFVVSTFWQLIALIFRLQIQAEGRKKGQAAKERLQRVIPQHKLVPDLRSAGALAPESYFPLIAEGCILPYQGEIAGFSPEAVQLTNGEQIPCDLVVLSLGSQTPIFPFLPEKYRCLLEGETDGVQLYRHLIHPRIPRLGFAGFNHGFMHVPAVEIGTLWLCAVLQGELELPSPEVMEQSIERVRQWKRAHIHFEPSRSCAVNTRFQQYIDILLKDLDISPYRKLPNLFAEIFGRYMADDYRTVLEEYNQQRRGKRAALRPLPVDT